MKFKAAVVGDLHLSDSSPESRLDDYTRAIINKLVFILEYCRQKEIPHIIATGDIFHRKAPNLNSHWLVQTLIELIQSYHPIKFYTVVGNHDYTTDISVLPKQPIMTLFKSGTMIPVGLSEDPIGIDMGSFKVELNGKPYSDRKDGTEKDPTAYNIKFSDEADLKIGVFHATLLPDGQSFFGDWINFADVENTCTADIVVCGHYHPGFNPPVLTVRGKTWINPGAVARGSAEDHNLTRQVQFVTCLYDGKDFVTKTVPIPVAPAADIFDLDKLQKRKEDIDLHSKFIGALTEVEDEELDISSVQQLCLLAESLSNDKQAVMLVKELLFEASDIVNP